MERKVFTDSMVSISPGQDWRISGYFNFTTRTIITLITSNLAHWPNLMKVTDRSWMNCNTSLRGSLFKTNRRNLGERGSRQSVLFYVWVHILITTILLTGVDCLWLWRALGHCGLSWFGVFDFWISHLVSGQKAEYSCFGDNVFLMVAILAFRGYLHL